MAAAVSCDTSALLDYLVASAADHHAFRTAIDSARARYIPGLVLAEVDYFLRGARKAMRALTDRHSSTAGFLRVPGDVPVEQV